jgi:large subunit ribosomal protein L17
MRHRVKGKILGREAGPRKALYRNLATSIVLYERIKTTEAKAKAVRPMVEKMITLGKRNTLAARRQLLAFFYVENAVKKILEDLAPRYKTRAGGYLRITPIGRRLGDAAKMVMIEFV